MLFRIQLNFSNIISIRLIGTIIYFLSTAVLRTRHWPESSGLGNDFWLATLPLALPPKIFLHFSLHYAILSQKVFGGNAIGNVVNQKLATLPRPDDSGQCLSAIFKFVLIFRS